MADAIDAHITIVHGTSQVGSLDEHIERIAATTPPVVVRLASVACWGTPEGGIYLGVDDDDGAIASMRRALGVVDPPGVTYAPHVTLLHPRTTRAELARRAWEALEGWSIDAEVGIDLLAIVELHGSRWRVTKAVKLTGSGP